MSTPRRPRGDTLDSTASSTSRDEQHHQNAAAAAAPTSSYLGASSAAPQPTYASFSPATLSASSKQPVSAAKRLSTILVHQKSPLLLATPPQVTRALAYSHPFLLPLNKLAGLLTWTTGDAWESFLLLAVFWAVVLYGDVAIRFAGPVVLVLLLIGGMYGRRFSPLSSSGWSEDGGAGGGTTLKAGKAKRKTSAASDSTSGAGPSTPSSKKNTAASSLSGVKKGGDGKAGGGGGGGGSHHGRAASEATNTKHQKTLDEIVETLKEFTARCNILLEPLLELTDFLSTQRTATSATTRPALTTLFVRILLCTPFWVALTCPPFRVVTTRRVMLCFGTIVLTWHARVVKAGRTILWRSASVRRLAALITGLEIPIPVKPVVASKLSDATAAAKAAAATTTKGTKDKAATGNGKSAAGGQAKNGSNSRESELTKAIRRARVAHDAGVRFTFIIYENQRRWVGLGWTNSLFAYERAAWTDEHNNPVPSRDKFELPEVEEDTQMRWRWVEGSRWRVDGVPDEAVSISGKDGEWDFDGEGGKNGWVYYDNKWQNGRRGQDGWGRWTRRRKWYRDAELVEIDSDDDEEEERQNNDDNNNTNPAKAPHGGNKRDNPKNTTTTTTAVSSSTEDTPTPTPGFPPPPSAAAAAATTTKATTTEQRRSHSPSPALPPRPRSPTLAPPYTTTALETMSMPDLLLNSNSTGGGGLKEIKEEGGDHEKDKEETSSVLSTTSSSTFSRSSMRFRVPSLRRRVTDAKVDTTANTTNPNKNPNNNSSPRNNSPPPPAITTPAGGASPRAVSISAYSTTTPNNRNNKNKNSIRSRRTSEVQSEDDAASLGPQVGLEISRDRGDSSWGVGDEVVMGLE